MRNNDIDYINELDCRAVIAQRWKQEDRPVWRDATGRDDIESLLTSPIDAPQCFVGERYILLRACNLFLVFNSKQFLF